MRYTEQQRAQMIRDCEDELFVLRNGTTCAPKHVKRYCRNRSMYLNWVINRLSKNLSIENVPSTKYCPPRIAE